MTIDPVAWVKASMSAGGQPSLLIGNRAYGIFQWGSLIEMDGSRSFIRPQPLPVDMEIYEAICGELLRLGLCNRPDLGFKG